jgi:hypothetical protein
MIHQTRNFKTSLGFLILFATTGQFFMAQADKPYTLWVGLFFYVLALWELKTFPLPPISPAKPLSPKTEALLLVLILGLACILRLYQIDSLPAGMHTDQGLTGLCALRIEHEGWRPFNEIFNYQIPEVLLFYQLAAWFSWVGDSLFHFHLFFTLQALAALVFFYATFRQLSGSRTALLSLFILAVMRWNWIETRTGYPSSEVLFYLFGALCFWVYGLRKQKKWAFILSALFMGAGLYTYQAFKLVPFLFFIYAAAEYFQRRKETTVRFSTIATYLLIVFLLALPLLNYFWNQKTLGNRERDVFIGTQISEQKSLKPLLDVWAGNALMFNRIGDETARHNIPGHRMLDDITGVLFILGLGLAFRQWKRPDAFYSLSGFFVLALAGLLSNQANNSNRLVVLTAFVAFFAGSFLEWVWDNFNRFMPSQKKATTTFIFFLLTVMTTQNVHTYFIEQACDERCRFALGLEQATIGQTMDKLEKDSPANHNFFLQPPYFDNHVVNFLGYSAREDRVSLDLGSLDAGDFPRDKDAVFFLGENKSASFGFLKTIFPKGQETLLKNTQGHVLLYQYKVSKKELSFYKAWRRGPRGFYWTSDHPKGKPFDVNSNPVLNFTNKWDFPFEQGPPFFIRWKGQIIIPTSGIYVFKALTEDKATVFLDGKAAEKERSLSSGLHSIRIDYQKLAGETMSLNLIWKKPGSSWEPLPAEAFGPRPRY